MQKNKKKKGKNAVVMFSNYNCTYDKKSLHFSEARIVT
jgi:SET domain-containing protein